MQQARASIKAGYDITLIGKFTALQYAASISSAYTCSKQVRATRAIGSFQKIGNTTMLRYDSKTT